MTIHYPTEEDLVALHRLAGFEALQAGGVDPLLDHLRSIWWRADMGIVWTPETGALELHTWGWSGNEDIIATLRTTMFWAFSWQTIRRGGHYYLNVPAAWNPLAEKGDENGNDDDAKV